MDPIAEAGDIATAFTDAWNRHDPDALAELFAEEADFVNVVGLWWTTRAQIRKAHAYGFDRIFGSSVMRLDTVRVRELGPDAAVVHAAWRLSGQTPHGDQAAGPRKGVFTFVVQRQTGGGWLAVAAQNTDRVSGAETHITADGSLRPAHYGKDARR